MINSCTNDDIIRDDDRGEGERGELVSLGKGTGVCHTMATRETPNPSLGV